MGKFVREHVCKKENPMSLLLYFLKEKLVTRAFTQSALNVL